MSLLINTSDHTNSSKYRAIIGRTNKRKWKLDYPVVKLEESLRTLRSDERDKLINLALQDRVYIKKLGREVDSHLELEKLGVGESSRNYTMIISLEESLDYVLYALMGTPIEVTRSIPNYFEISKNFVTLDTEKITMTYEELMLVHPTIERYILEEALKFTELVPIYSDDFNKQFNSHFLRKIADTSDEILNSIVCNLFHTYEKQYVLRSKGCGVYVVSTDNPTSLEVMLSTGDGIIYTLNLRTYPKMGYLFEVSPNS